MLEVGFGPHPPNTREAVRFYEQAASLGNTDAIFNLALAYQNGVYVEIDEIRAIDLMKKAANMGHLNSQNYLVDLGIARDKSEFISKQELEPYSSEGEYEEEESEEDKGDETFQRIQVKEKTEPPLPKINKEETKDYVSL